MRKYVSGTGSTGHDDRLRGPGRVRRSDRTGRRGVTGGPPRPRRDRRFERDPTAYDDLAEFAPEEWRESTTARERVRDVAARLLEPATATEVAERTDVSPPTARAELGDLVQDDVVATESGERGTTYRRDPDWYRIQRVRDVADQPRAVVVDVLQRLDREIRAYRERYGVESPEDLLLEEEDLDDEAWQDCSEWRSALVDRQYVKTALRFQELRTAEANNWTDDGTATGSSRDDRDAAEP